MYSQIFVRTNMWLNDKEIIQDDSLWTEHDQETIFLKKNVSIDKMLVLGAAPPPQKIRQWRTLLSNVRCTIIVEEWNYRKPPTKEHNSLMRFLKCWNCVIRRFPRIYFFLLTQILTNSFSTKLRILVPRDWRSVLPTRNRGSTRVLFHFY